MIVKDARRVGVYGASGSGKSTRVKILTRESTRTVVFDPLDEYGREGFARLTTIAGVLEHLKRSWGRGFRIAYVPPAGREPEYLHKLSKLLQAAQRPYFDGRDGRKIAVVVEEMNLSFPVTGLPQALDGFPNLCSRGRHYGIEIFGVTQRLAEINTRFRGNTNAAYFFQLGDHVDVAAALRMIGPAWRAELDGLQPHEFLLKEGGQVTRGRNELGRAKNRRKA